MRKKLPSIIKEIIKKLMISIYPEILNPNVNFKKFLKCNKNKNKKSESKKTPKQNGYLYETDHRNRVIKLTTFTTKSISIISVKSSILYNLDYFKYSPLGFKSLDVVYREYRWLSFNSLTLLLTIKHTITINLENNWIQ